MITIAAAILAILIVGLAWSRDHRTQTARANAAEKRAEDAETERDAYAKGVAKQAVRATKAEVRADDLDSTVGMLQWQITTLEQAADWHEATHQCLAHLDGIRELSPDDFDAALKRLQAKRVPVQVGTTPIYDEVAGATVVPIRKGRAK